MRINTNLTAMNTFTQYTKNNNKIADSVEKLSSGYAINSAADNAAGLAISEKMRAQIRGLEQASVNSQDAISLIQTAEGGLNESTEILQRMRELAVQSANDTNENEIDREALQDEFAQLQEELNNIAKTTTFNKKNLLDGSLAKKQASTQNLSLANSGLSVSLGNVAAGNYNFQAVIKAESAEVDAATAKMTAVSTDSKISVGEVTIDEATSTIANTSLANGNYDIEASWNSDTKEMTFTAKGDNGQTFTATLSKNDLDTYAQDPENSDLTLDFGNGTSKAFSMTLDTKTTYSTTNDSTMNTVASEFSNALTISASGGVDYKAAEYALYATMTGAEDVKLEAGMSSVSFSNGVTVSFDELTTSDVTIVDANGTGATFNEVFSTAATPDTPATNRLERSTWALGQNAFTADDVSVATKDGDDTNADSALTLTNFDFDDAIIPAGDLSVTGVESAGTVTYTVTIDDTDYTATVSAENITTLNGATAETPATVTLQFKNGEDVAFTADLTNTVTANAAGGTTAQTIASTDLGTSLTIGVEAVESNGGGGDEEEVTNITLGAGSLLGGEAVEYVNDPEDGSLVIDTETVTFEEGDKIVLDDKTYTWVASNANAEDREFTEYSDLVELINADGKYEASYDDTEYEFTISLAEDSSGSEDSNTQATAPSVTTSGKTQTATINIDGTDTKVTAKATAVNAGDVEIPSGTYEVSSTYNSANGGSIDLSTTIDGVEYAGSITADTVDGATLNEDGTYTLEVTLTEVSEENSFRPYDGGAGGNTITVSYTLNNNSGDEIVSAAGAGLFATNIVAGGGGATSDTSSFTVEVDNGDGLTFQIGANQGDELVINVDRMDAEYLGVSSADILSRENASNALSAVDDALNQVASQRAYLGAMQNRLDHKIANLDTSAENLTAAEGQIRDVDMAKEMTEFTNANILSQAATAMLAQANSLPQNVLSLIG